MNCDIVVNISRSNLRVFYSQNKNSYKSFKFQQSENIPFYVFSDGNEFEVGDSAKIKFQNHFLSFFMLSGEPWTLEILQKRCRVVQNRGSQLDSKKYNISRNVQKNNLAIDPPKPIKSKKNFPGPL